MSDRLLLSYRDVDVYQRDANLLNNGQWLNDTCINFCFRCIEDKCSDVKLVDPAVVSFLRLQVEDEEEYDDLAKGLQLDCTKWLYCPINDNNSFAEASSHWSALLVQVESGHCFSLDSQGEYNRNSTRSLLPKLSTLLKRDLQPLCSVDCPQQSNGYDCGVYVVIYAEMIVDFIVSHPAGSDMGTWRERLGEKMRLEFTSSVPANTRKKYRKLIDDLK